jgi:hypothetical protein
MRSKDKAPFPFLWGMGPCICFVWGLRVSRILDLRTVSGSKSDTPTRAKNCEESYSNEQRRSRQRRIHPPSLYELWRGKGDSRQKTRGQRSEPQRSAGILEGWNGGRMDGEEDRRQKIRRRRSEIRAHRRRVNLRASEPWSPRVACGAARGG